MKTSVRGIGSAASMGGSTALMTAMSRAATRAPQNPFTERPGTRPAAANSAAAATSHLATSRIGWVRRGVGSTDRRYGRSAPGTAGGGGFTRVTAGRVVRRTGPGPSVVA